MTNNITMVLEPLAPPVACDEPMPLEEWAALRVFVTRPPSRKQRQWWGQTTINQKGHSRKQRSDLIYLIN